MSKFIDRKDVAAKVENEGLGYFIMDYTGPDSMPDDELKGAFIAAKDALQNFQMLLPDPYEEEE